MAALTGLTDYGNESCSSAHMGRERKGASALACNLPMNWEARIPSFGGRRISRGFRVCIHTFRPNCSRFVDDSVIAVDL